MKNFLKKFRQKPSVKSCLIILLCASIFCIPLFHELVGGHMFNSQDMSFHIQRFIGTRDALADGQLIPQLDPNVLDGFGSATNMFYGPLSAYINVILNTIFNGNFVRSIPIFFIIFIYLAGFSMYLLSRYITKKESSACISAIVYMSMPFFVRSAFQLQYFGIVLAFALLPLLILGFYKILDNKKSGVLLLSLSAAGLILSHALSTAIIAVFVVILCAINWRRVFRKTTLLKLFASLLFALMISAFFILPFLAAKSLGIYNIFDGDFLACFMLDNYMYLDNYSTSLPELFFSNSGASIGLIAIAVIGFALLNFKKLSKQYNSKWFLLIGILFALLSTELVPWQYMPSEFWIIQFPWRLVLISGFCFSLIAGDVVDSGTRKFKNAKTLENIIIVVVAIMAISAYQSYPEKGPMSGREHVSHVAAELDSIPATSGIATGEYLPKQIIGMTEPTTKNIMEHSKSPEFIFGTSNISNYEKSGSHINFSIETDGLSEVELPIIYYPGYTVKLDGKVVENTWSDSGFVKFSVDQPGAHSVEVRFAGSDVTKISLIVSILGIAGLTLYTIHEYRHRAKKKR